MLEQILENYPESEFLIADGFDEAILGYDYYESRLIYSVVKCIEILKKEMSEEDAIDYFNYNVCNTYAGEGTPIWCWDNF